MIPVKVFPVVLACWALVASAGDDWQALFEEAAAAHLQGSADAEALYVALDKATAKGHPPSFLISASLSLAFRSPLGLAVVLPD